MSPSGREGLNRSRDPEGTTLIPHLACASVMTNQSQSHLLLVEGVGWRQSGNDLRASVSHTGSVLTTAITPSLTPDAPQFSQQQLKAAVKIKACRRFLLFKMCVNIREVKQTHRKHTKLIALTPPSPPSPPPPSPPSRV